MSSPSPLIAENYHLKWNSHLTNLNLSLTSLFKTERFADVMLVSSHPACLGGPAIPAHKIILSSCSHFFSTIFTNQLAQTGLMYVMLPPELSYRCIKILVQYMYSGESTISHDILNEVLRGGEILKIRGLYKSRSRQTSQRSSTPSIGNIIGNPLYQSPLPSLPKESPVIMKLPNKQTPKNTSCSVPLPIIEKGLITIKKDIAIDPECGEICSSNLLKTTSNNNCTQNGCKNSLPPPLNCNIKEEPVTKEVSTEQKEITDKSDNCIKEKQKTCEPSTSGISTTKRKLIETSVTNKETQSTGIKNDEITSKNKNTELQKLDNLLNNQENSIKQEKDFIEAIKEEPMDWHQSNSENSSSSNSQLTVKPPSQIIEKIKIETVYEDVAVSEGDHTNDYYEIDDDDDESENFAPLECELCNEKFSLPRDWVRHIETHMDTTTTDVPKKKQKLTKKNVKENDVDNDYNIIALKCDLCSTFYNSPAEWVRHIENEHTEKELAAVNNIQDGFVPPCKEIFKNENGKKKFDSYLSKSCDICGEEFVSYAKMIIHYRTHITKKN